MNATSDCIPCIGAALWDIIGRHTHAMHPGDDRPGHIDRLPGGVALNVARTLRRFSLNPILLAAIGTDRAGDDLVTECTRCGVDTGMALRLSDRPTDLYLAIEDANGLVAAVADSRALETAGGAVLAPLSDGRLGSPAVPFAGPVVIDGNLGPEQIALIADTPVLAFADLRIVLASPGKAARLRPLLGLSNATFYLNLREASRLADADFRSSGEAAAALLGLGATRVLVTNGSEATTDASADTAYTAHPPEIALRRVTGAGDTFVAAHLAAELRGHARAFSLEAALQAAATFASGCDA